MLRTFVAFLCMCFAAPAYAKLGETVPQLVKRFGKNYTVESVQTGKKYKFRSARISVDAVVADGVSVSETYLSDHPLTAIGEPPNDIVRAVLKTNAPQARWVEIEAASFGADYASRSSDDKYVAILNYAGPQPENNVWTMTVGLAKSIRTLSNTTSLPVTSSPPASTATPAPSSSQSPTPSSTPAPTPEIDFVPSTPLRFEETKAKAETGDHESEYQVGVRYYKGDGVGKDFAQAVSWFRKAAEQNYAPAQTHLGFSYATGEGVRKDEVEAVKWFRKAAEQNYAPAQTYLGYCYATGKGVTKDEMEAVKWYRKAGEQLYPSAQTYLGDCYAMGEGVTKDEVEAVKWYRKAAEQNYARAQNNLGSCYANAKGVPKDETEAVKWYRRAAEQNFTRAQSNLGLCYANGRGVPKDEAEAVKWYQKAAEKNDVKAQTALAYRYANGKGVTKDEAEAVKLYRKAADQNYAPAQNALGIAYAHGHGVTKDETEAVKWFRKAAEQNYAPAQYNLGSSYVKDEAVEWFPGNDPWQFKLDLPHYNGQGVTKSYAEAIKWYHKAAEQNYAAAQYSLGACYANGQGVAKDDDEAAKWYRKAAEQNYARAQFSLGFCYAKGQGVERNDEEAVKWYQKAAEQNYAPAQTNLGYCYAQGLGVPKDYVESYKWALLAAAHGDKNAKEIATVLENNMSREQIAEGQKLARNFKPREVPVAEANISETAILQSRPESSGTGFFITEDGFLVTNEHVVKDAVQIRLVTSAGLISARVAKVDAANDLALLKAEGKFPPLPVAASRGVKLGSAVVAVGFPNVGLQGFAPKFARGEIGSLSGPQDDARYFQISVPVQPGNSGSALVDEHGNVVGVVSAGLSLKAALATSGTLPQNVNYAVKSSFLLGFLESVPEVAAKLKEPNTKDMKFDDVVDQAKEAAVLVLVY